MNRSVPSALVLFSLGCSVAEVEPPPDTSAVNQCATTSECHGGGRCEGNICVARSTELNDVLIEVVRPTTAFGSGGLPFYLDFSELPPLGERLDLDLPAISNVDGRVTIDPAIMGCEPDPESTAPNELLPAAGDETIPVDVVFTPSERLLGLASPIYGARAELTSGKDETLESYTFSLNVPPGNYDVYLKPRPVEGVACTPPLLLVNQPVGASGKLDVILPQPQRLDITVRWPENNIEGSIVDLLDPVSGRVVSTASALGPPFLSQPTSSVGYVTNVTLWYFPVYTLGADGKFKPTASAGKEIVRLSPTSDTVSDRPIIYAARDATNAMGELLQVGALPKDVIVEGLALVRGETKPVEAVVTLTANSLEGFDPGVFASFTRTVQVGADGHFLLNVPPGNYRVDAVPMGKSAACKETAAEADAPCFGAVHTQWDVPKAQVTPGAIEPGPLVQGGKVVEFERAAAVSGRAIAPTGPLSGAGVRASVSPFSVRSSLLDRALGDAATLPRSASAFVGSDGSFSFLADSGVYDLFVQPDPASRFGWYVRPSLSVEPADLDLENLNVPLPVAYHGVVTSLTGPYAGVNVVPDVLIRAYTHVSDPNDPERKAAIQIAETRADSNGAFELLIPSRLDDLR